MHFFVYSLSLIFLSFSSVLYEIRCKYDYFYSNYKEKIDFFSLFFFNDPMGTQLHCRRRGFWAGLIGEGRREILRCAQDDRGKGFSEVSRRDKAGEETPQQPDKVVPRPYLALAYRQD